MLKGEVPEIGDGDAFNVTLSFIVSSHRDPDELKAVLNRAFEDLDPYIHVFLQRNGMAPHGLVVVDSVERD